MQQCCLACPMLLTVVLNLISIGYYFKRNNTIITTSVANCSASWHTNAFCSIVLHGSQCLAVQRRFTFQRRQFGRVDAQRKQLIFRMTSSSSPAFLAAMQSASRRKIGRVMLVYAGRATTEITGFLSSSDKSGADEAAAAAVRARK